MHYLLLFPLYFCFVFLSSIIFSQIPFINQTTKYLESKNPEIKPFDELYANVEHKCHSEIFP